MSLDADPSAFFRRSWSLYDAIVESNHMGHREFYAQIGQVIARHPQVDSLLDLGCGNARCLAPVLQASSPRHYVGVDLSEQALEEAARYLVDLPGVELRCEDLLDYCSNRTASAGIIFSGFAVHHLSDVEKGHLFREVFRILPAGGFFLLLDVIKEEGESRESHVLAYTAMMRDEWRDIPEMAMREGCDHVLHYDDPASQSELQRLADQAGFDGEENLLIMGRHVLTLFRKSRAD